MPHVCRRHYPRDPKDLDGGPGPVSSAEPDDGCRRSQEARRARLSLDHPGHQALPRGLRSAAKNRDVRPRAVRSDDGVIPALGGQSVVVDVWIPAAITCINRLKVAMTQQETRGQGNSRKLRKFAGVNPTEKESVCQLLPPRTALRSFTRTGVRASRSCSAMAGRFRRMTGITR